MRTELQQDVRSFWLRTLPLLLCGLLLVARLADALWSDSVDLAHHYALAARLAQHWVLPAAYDPSLGEMNVYPSGAHLLAALVGRVANSTLLGLQLTACAAVVAIWVVLLLFLRQLPARAAVLSGVTLLALLLLNRHLQWLVPHGGELVTNFFYAQLTAQAGALLAMLAALAIERAGLPVWWRYLLLLAAIQVLCSVHLMPALELLAVLGLGCALDLLPLAGRQRRQSAAPLARLGAVLPALLAPLIGALLLVRHPGYAVMRSLSDHDGGIFLHNLNSPLALGLYAGGVLLLSLIMLYSWRQAPAGEAARHALGLKYIGLYGGACALMCVLQSLALLFHVGTDYAVKKYVYALHTALLLELCMVPALLLAWHRRTALYPTPARKLAWGQAARLLSPLLLALAVLQQLSPRIPHADTSTLVRLEQQLTTVRDLRLAEPAGRYTYAARLGVSPAYAYMFSIGVFGVPRDNNAGDLLGDRIPGDLAQVGHLLTIASLAEAQPYARCRQVDSPAGLALLDGACLQAEISPPEQHIALTDKNPAMLCQLTGFSAPEQNGSWSSAKTAVIACPVPKRVAGKPPTLAVLATQAFLESLPLQRLEIRVNGAAPATFRYDAATPARLLELPLPANATALTLTLSLPDARSPQALGLGADQRELGVMVRSISFH